MQPKELKPFIGKVVKVEIYDHASYDNAKDIEKEGPCILTTYGVVKRVAKDPKLGRWFLNITYDLATNFDGKFLDESGATYLLTDVLSITELHE
jgi:hypothetical protein